MIQASQFRFVLKYGAGLRRIANPTGSDGAKIRAEKEPENLFFRSKLSGDLSFSGADFKLIHRLLNSEDRCKEVGLDVERQCGTGFERVWAGAFSLTDAKYDLDFGTARIGAFVVNDAYRNILENWGKEFNILTVPNRVSVSARLDFRTNFEFRYYDTNDGISSLPDSDTWADFLNAPYWIDGVIGQNGTRSRMNIAFRLVRSAPFTVNAQFPDGFPADLSGDGWKIIADDPNTKVAQYAKQPNLYNFKPYVWGTKNEWSKYPELRQINCGATFDPARYISITGTGPGQVQSGNCSPGCLSIRYYVNDPRCRGLVWEFGTFNFDRNRKLIDVLYFLLQQTCPENCPSTPAEISEFFTSATNYVTNAPNRLADLLIAQITDIISFRSSEPATKGMLSLKKLLAELRKMFNVFWFIDENGKFRLEHRSFFSQTGTMDMTVPRFERWTRGTRQFEFDKTKMPRFERLKFGEFFGDDFAQGEAEYSGACVNTREGEDVKEELVSGFTTDLQGLMITGETSDKKGFVLLAQSGGSVINERGDLTGTIIANGHLSAANLFATYHKAGRVLLSGKMNGKPAIFSSVVKTKKQKSIIFPYCCEDILNPFATFVTTLGPDGELASSELTLKDGMMKIDVLHASEPDNLLPFPRQFDGSFDPSFA